MQALPSPGTKTKHPRIQKAHPSTPAMGPSLAALSAAMMSAYLAGFCGRWKDRRRSRGLSLQQEEQRRL